MPSPSETPQIQDSKHIPSATPAALSQHQQAYIDGRNYYKNKDFQKAAQCFEAAKTSISNASIKLAEIYWYGAGDMKKDEKKAVPMDIDKAFAELRHAAMKNHPK